MNEMLEHFSPEDNLYPDNFQDLPLHHVTQEFGTDGLTRRFFMSLESAGLDTDEHVIGAFALAVKVHSGQERSNGPYIDHILRVATRVIDHFGIDDKDIIIAALLHDSVEDRAFDVARKHHPGRFYSSSDEGREAAFDVIEHEYGSTVRETVYWLTNPIVNGDDKQKQRIYDDHTIELVNNSPRARVVKLADFVDNAVGNHYTIGHEKQKKLDIKYIDAYKVHRAGLYMQDSLITGDTRERLTNQLINAEVKARMRLGYTD